MSLVNNTLLDQLTAQANYNDKLKLQREFCRPQSLASSLLFPTATAASESILSSYFLQKCADQQLREALTNHQRSAAALKSAAAAASLPQRRQFLLSAGARLPAFPSTATATPSDLLLASSGATSTAATGMSGLATNRLGFPSRTSARPFSVYEALDGAMAAFDDVNSLVGPSVRRPLLPNVTTATVNKISPSPQADGTLDKEVEQDDADTTKARTTVVRDDYWDQLFQRLKEYKEKHGDCLVPSRYPEDRQLGRWVSRQRERHAHLSKECKDLLNEIGFTWCVFKRKSWESMFDRLVQYKMKHGNCLVPARFKDDPRLGRWVRKQRMVHSTISAERKNTLNSIGFVWNVR